MVGGLRRENGGKRKRGYVESGGESDHLLWNYTINLGVRTARRAPSLIWGSGGFWVKVVKLHQFFNTKE